MTEKGLEELKNEDKEQLDEYFKFIKDSVKDKSYFKDAMDWYYLRYVNPLCDRTIMAFAAIIAAVSFYFLVQIISNTFPLVEKVPIVIKDHDSSIYRPVIRELKDKNVKEIANVDELVAKYLVSSYVIDRESYDYRKSEVRDVNIKFNRIKNVSSYGEYKNFQLFMSKDNANSPLNNFGRDVYRTTEISSVVFAKAKNEDYYSKFKNFFTTKIPTEAEIRFTTITHTAKLDGGEDQIRENFLVKIKFDFAGLNREAKSGVLNFVVNDYKLYKIK